MLAAEGLSKSYPGVKALEGVSIQIQPGECVALAGENGAGKSTLIRLLSGYDQPDSGEVLAQTKIGVIWQELSGIPDLSVAENIFLGHEVRRGWRIETQQMHSKARALLDRVGCGCETTTLLKDLSIAEQQMVEVAKALAREASFLIMDEPTSSLSSTETAALLGLVRELKAQGVGVLYVSHRLSEIESIADRVVVLRDGRNAGELAAGSITASAIAELMVGRELSARTPTSHATPHQVLNVEGLVTQAHPKHANSFVVHSGEIVCIAGLVGSGRTEILETLAGVLRPKAGQFALNGRDFAKGSVPQALRAGVCLVPEDRRHCGLLTELSVAENIVLPSLRGLIRRAKEEQQLVETAVERLQIKVSSPDVAAGTLSGGNQQKVVFGKWWAQAPQLLLLDEPTRGVDVGSKAEIYDLLEQLAATGMACLVVSSDMEEVLRLADRILVCCDGRITGELTGDERTEANILRLATEWQTQ